MNKPKNPFAFVWKNNRVWLLVTSITLVLLLVISLVTTQVVLIRNTINTVLGDERRVLVSGDPSQYIRYKNDEGQNSKAETLAAGNALNEKINEEGIVLLKNDNSLPLSPLSKVSVFGKNSVNLVYGGSGSGGMASDSAKTIYQSLADAGFIINTDLQNFYKNNSASGSGRSENPKMGDKPEGLATGETPQSSYTAGVKSSYSNFNDAAIVVISRIGGEGWDLPRTMKGISGANASDHYLQLDNNEKALIESVTAEFSNVIVVINSSASMELEFIQNNPKIKGALWIGAPGGTGIMALGKVLKGDVNPSGRLVDTYARDFSKAPSWQNFSNNFSATGNMYTVDSVTQENSWFVDYEEGIYIGYRYYETRAFTEGGNWHQENVVYPFGYGLSYTNFSYELEKVTLPENTVLKSDDTIGVNIKVTNTGDKPGKEVVQMYYSAPYLDEEIEKAHVVLGDFGKTKILKQNESEVITLNIKASDMASYDFNDANDNGFEGYELDGGNYNMLIGKDAHDAWSGDNNIQITYSVPEGGFRFDKDSASGNSIENQFEDVSNHIKNYMSRSDFEGTFPSKPTDEDREVKKSLITSLSEEAYIGKGTKVDKDKPWYTSQMPSQQNKTLSLKDTKVQLYQLIEEDGTVKYDNELWDKLLDQLTAEQMAYLIGTGNFNTALIENIGKPKTIDPDGPAGFTNFMAVGAAAPVYDTCFYASECVIGATYNKELAFEMGKAVGNESLVGNERGDGRTYSGWYAPAVNIHRTPFSGRNFEYYSEDGYLSGILGANVVQGAKTKGVYTYVKHFALNDQETDRGGLITWASEQSMRELYFRPFEIIVKEGKTTAMMSSFNRIGTVWAGGSYELLTNVLRKEWGFKGMVISDYNTYAHMPANQMIRAGGDLNLFQDKKPSLSGSVVNASHVTAMRNATKNILYTVAGSNAMNGMGSGVVYRYDMPIWMICVILVDVAAVVGFGIWGFFSIRGKVKKQKAAAETVQTNSK